MKKIIILLLLITSQVFASNATVNNVELLGGVESTSTLTVPEGNSSAYFTIICGTNNITIGNFIPCSKNGTPYQVTTGKTFKSIKLCFWANTTNDGLQIVSATAPIANNAASLTGGVFESGVTATYVHTSGPTSNVWTCSSNSFDFASSTYAGVELNAVAIVGVMILGKEI